MNTIGNIMGMRSDVFCMQMYAKSYRVDFSQEVIDKIENWKKNGMDFIVSVCHKQGSLPAEVSVQPFVRNAVIGKIIGGKMKRGHVWLYIKGKGGIIEWKDWTEVYKKLVPPLTASPQEKEMLAEERKQSKIIKQKREENASFRFMMDGISDNIRSKSSKTDWDCFEFNQTMKRLDNEFKRITKCI